jgi:hypothetical protein
MGILKKHLAENFVPVTFDPDELASVLESQLPEVDFCLLMGSSVNPAGSACSLHPAPF